MVRKQARQKKRATKKPITKQTVAKIVKNALFSQQNVEIKRNRNMINSALTAGVTSYANTLTSITVGTSDLANRIGDRINLKSLISRGRIAWSGVGQDSVRVLIFLWNQDIGANAPNDSELFDDTATSLTRIYGSLNYDFRYPLNKRYTLIYDKSFTLSSDNQVVSFDKTFNLKGKQAQCDSGASFSTNGQGMPYIAYLSNTTPTLMSYMTVEYNDL